jgi:hypothetical protein
MEINLGDVIAVVELRVPGLVRSHPHRHYGAPRKRRGNTADRGQRRPVATAGAAGTPIPIGVEMDLKADQEVDVRTAWTDEVGNPAPTPPDASATWETDNTSVLEIIDNGDGTATLGAVGALGQAHVRVTVTAGGREHVGEDVVNVVTGDAERVAVEFGEPRERTPDDAPVL